MTRTGSIRGKVVRTDRTPVGGAAVLITGDSPSHQDIAAVSNDAGEYSFTDLEPGKYTLLVNADDRPSQTRSVIVRAQGWVQLDFVLPE